MKAPLQGKKRYLRKKLMPIITARTRGNMYIKPPALPTKKVHRKTQTLRKDKLLPFLVFFVIIYYTPLFWLGCQRHCDRHHTGDHSQRSGILTYAGIQVRDWTHLSTFNSTDEIIPHQLVFYLLITTKHLYFIVNIILLISILTLLLNPPILVHYV